MTARDRIIAYMHRHHRPEATLKEIMAVLSQQP